MLVCVKHFWIHVFLITGVFFFCDYFFLRRQLFHCWCCCNRSFHFISSGSFFYEFTCFVFFAIIMNSRGGARFEWLWRNLDEISYYLDQDWSVRNKFRSRSEIGIRDSVVISFNKFINFFKIRTRKITVCDTLSLKSNRNKITKNSSIHEAALEK